MLGAKRWHPYRILLIPTEKDVPETVLVENFVRLCRDEPALDEAKAKEALQKYIDSIVKNVSSSGGVLLRQHDPAIAHIFFFFAFFF